MKVIKYQLLLAVVLLVGVAIGYFFGGEQPQAEAPQAEGYQPKKPIESKGESASLMALRKRIAELEKALAEKGEMTQESFSNAVAEAVKARPQPPGRPPFGNPREWLENLKKTDPARFTQMTNRFAQWRRNRAERTRTTMDFLSSIDTSNMSAAAKKTHDELQELIAKREALEEQLHQEDITDEQRHQIFEQMRATDRAMRQLNQQERSNLIEETARNLGFEGDAVKEISATIQEVIEATGGNGHGGFGPPPGGGPGGPGGPGGR